MLTWAKCASALTRQQTTTFESNVFFLCFHQSAPNISHVFEYLEFPQPSWPLPYAGSSSFLPTPVKLAQVTCSDQKARVELPTQCCTGACKSSHSDTTT